MIGTSWKNDRNREKFVEVWHPAWGSSSSLASEKCQTKPRAEGFGLESRGVGQGRERDVGNCPGPEMTAVRYVGSGGYRDSTFIWEYQTFTGVYLDMIYSNQLDMMF